MMPLRTRRRHSRGISRVWRSARGDYASRSLALHMVTVAVISVAGGHLLLPSCSPQRTEALRLLPKSHIRLLDAKTLAPISGSGLATDNDFSTVWSSPLAGEIGGPSVLELVVDLGAPRRVTGVSYWLENDLAPRVHQRLRLFAGMTSHSFGEPIAEAVSSGFPILSIYEWDRKPEIAFEPQECRFLKLRYELTPKTAQRVSTVGLVELDLFGVVPSTDAPADEKPRWKRFKKDSGNTARLDAYLAGARVALVGPAGSFVGSGYGPEIDAHDVVMRVNWPPMPDREHQRDFGSRMHVFVTAMGHSRVLLDPRFSIGEELSWIALSVAGVEYMNVGGREIPVASPGVPDQLLYFAPATLTGIRTLAWLMEREFSSLDIYGFDFYHSVNATDVLAHGCRVREPRFTWPLYEKHTFSAALCDFTWQLNEGTVAPAIFKTIPTTL